MAQLPRQPEGEEDGVGACFSPRDVAMKLKSGPTLNGKLMSESAFSATVVTADGKFHLLARDGETYSEKPIEPKHDWLGYDGEPNGNRYSAMDQISSKTVDKLAPAWIFPVLGAPRLEVTPVVADGVMYITGANEAYALDATTGRQIWAFRTPRASGLLGEAGGGANRGVALGENRVFMVTDNSHLLALNRQTGEKLWDVTMADSKEGYSATAAPMVVGDLVISESRAAKKGRVDSSTRMRRRQASWHGASGAFRNAGRRAQRRGWATRSNTDAELRG